VVSVELEEHVATIFRVEASQAADVYLLCKCRMPMGMGKKGRRVMGGEWKQ
jgi:hypothetical protein